MPVTARQYAYLEAMGIQVWSGRQAARPQPAAVDSAGAAALPAARTEVSGTGPVVAETAADAAEPGWEALQARVETCTGCELHRSRAHVVFGVGDRGADWMVVGEAPGAEEDRQGEPFVGRAGQLLNAMLAAIGLRRERVYIANILKCRPPNNRDPRPEEVARCEPYLQRQVALVAPRLILAVGRVAAQNLLKTDAPLGRLRGRVHHYGPTGVPVVVTYHPAYLLRSPGEKRKAWQDLLLARSTLGAGGTDGPDGTAPDGSAS